MENVRKYSRNTLFYTMLYLFYTCGPHGMHHVGDEKTTVKTWV